MNFKFQLTDFRFITLLFLFSCLVTSNHFLILNEETIVAICFISFIAFSFQYFGKTVQDSLDERNNAIKEEFLQALRLEEKYCQQVMYEHEEPIKKIGGFISVAKTLLSVKLQWYEFFRQKHLSTFFEQTVTILIESKLSNRINQFNYSKKIFEEKWLDLVASEFEASVLAELETANNTKFQELLLAQSISAVQKELAAKK